MTAIEHRYREQVQEANTDREHGGKIDKGNEADACHLARDLGNSNWAAKLIGRFPSSHHAPQIGKGLRDDEVALFQGEPEGGHWIVALHLPVFGRLAADYPQQSLAHGVAEIVGDLFAFWRRGELDILTAAFHYDAERLVGAHGDDALHLAEAFDLLAVDADDKVARLETCPFRRASGIHAIDLGRCDALAEEREDRGEDRDGENKIGNGACGDNGSAYRQGLRLETAFALLGRQLIERFVTRACGVLVIDELNVAAERNR